MMVHISFGPGTKTVLEMSGRHDHCVRHGSACGCCCCLGMCESGTAMNPCPMCSEPRLFDSIGYRRAGRKLGKGRSYPSTDAFWTCPKCSTKETT